MDRPAERVAIVRARTPMSFRNRLTLFFVLIVVVPMVAVAFVLFSLIATSESGKADARLAATKGSAINRKSTNATATIGTTTMRTKNSVNRLRKLIGFVSGR